MGIARLIKFLILIIGVYIAISLTGSNWQLWRQGKIVEQMELRNQKLQQEGEALRKKLSQVETEEFIEKEARDKLNMGMPGETIVIIPDTLLATSAASGSSKELPNWEKWLKLFN
jgi:cell division protein FtsB